jgi:XTP/dITP diphosphohydrolase
MSGPPIGIPATGIEIRIEAEADPDRRHAIVRNILSALPDWFGIPEAIARYAEDARGLTLLAARRRDETLGFITLKLHGAHAIELHCMGILSDHHRHGIGRRLLRAAEAQALSRGIEFLSVKTLAPEARSLPYERTRAFYRAMGFRELETFPTLWSKEDPCLLMVKALHMARRFEGKTLLVASHNEGKVREIAELLRPFGVEPVSAGSLGLPEPEETEKTFRGNAELKARASAVAAKLPALADDSGLAVDALDGAPGIYSARWAGETRDFKRAMEKVEQELVARGAVTEKDRRARFVCALSLCWPDGHCETFEGKVEGSLAFPPRGLRGFGYDPIFLPDGRTLTFGEMDPAEKHAISHRADAFRQLVAACFA